MIAPLNKTRLSTLVIRHQPLGWVPTLTPWSLPATNLAQTKYKMQGRKASKPIHLSTSFFQSLIKNSSYSLSFLQVHFSQLTLHRTLLLLSYYSLIHFRKTKLQLYNDLFSFHQIYQDSGFRQLSAAVKLRSSLSHRPMLWFHLFRELQQQNFLSHPHTHKKKYQSRNYKELSKLDTLHRK